MNKISSWFDKKYRVSPAIKPFVPMLCCLPALIFIVIFSLSPAILNLALSFTDYRSATTPFEFVGLQNYSEFFTLIGDEVKEVFSNGDIKEKTTETTHFLKTAFSDPFEAIEEIANEKNEVFPKTVILIALFVIISFVSQLISLIRSGGHYSFGSNFSSFISSITSPIIYIIVPSAVVFLFNTLFNSENRRNK